MRLDVLPVFRAFDSTNSPASPFLRATVAPIAPEALQRSPVARLRGAPSSQVHRNPNKLELEVRDAMHAQSDRTVDGASAYYHHSRTTQGAIHTLERLNLLLSFDSGRGERKIAAIGGVLQQPLVENVVVGKSVALHAGLVNRLRNTTAVVGFVVGIVFRSLIHGFGKGL